MASDRDGQETQDGNGLQDVQQRHEARSAARYLLASDAKSETEHQAQAQAHQHAQRGAARRRARTRDPRSSGMTSLMIGPCHLGAAPGHQGQHREGDGQQGPIPPVARMDHLPGKYWREGDVMAPPRGQRVVERACHATVATRRPRSQRCRPPSLASFTSAGRCGITA